MYRGGTDSGIRGPTLGCDFVADIIIFCHFF